MTEEQEALIADMDVRHVDFVRFRVENTDKSATWCATQAGYSEKTAHVQATRLLKNAKVQQLMQTFKVERTQSTIMSRDEMLERLTAMARTEVEDVVDIVTEDRQLMDMETGELLEGQTFWALKPPERMTNGGMKAISELTATNQGLKIKLHDQRAAMKQLAELQGFDAAKQVEVKVTKSLDDFYEDLDGDT